MRPRWICWRAAIRQNCPVMRTAMGAQFRKAIDRPGSGKQRPSPARARTPAVLKIGRACTPIYFE